MNSANVIDIKDLSDPRLDPYRNLRSRNPTRYGGRFVVESEKLVSRLVASNLGVESILVDSTVGQIPEEWIARSPSIFRVTDASPLIGFNFHRGALACGIQPAERSAIDWLHEATSDSVAAISAVYLHGVQDPENLGSIFRCCAALGVRHAILGPQSADPLSRRVIRVSMGAVLKLELLWDRAPVEFLHRAREQLIESVAATLRDDAVPLPRLSIGRRWILFLGNEAAGLPADLVAGCTQPVVIPMRLGVDSLNVAVAAGIFLYHLSTASAGASESASSGR